MFWLSKVTGTKLVMWDMEKGKCCVIDLAEAGVLPSSNSYRYEPKLFSLEDGNKLGLLWLDNFIYLMAEDVDDDKLEEVKVKYMRRIDPSERHEGIRLTCFTVGGYQGVDDDDGVMKKKHHPEIQIHYQRKCIYPPGSYHVAAFELEA